jgi:hypothetical protein
MQFQAKRRSNEYIGNAWIERKGKGREQFKGIKIEKKLILSDDPKAGSGQKPLSLMGFIK